MAPRRTKKEAAPAEEVVAAEVTETEAPKPAKKAPAKKSAPSLNAAELGKFLDLKNFDAALLKEYLGAAQKEADKYIGGYADSVAHLYKQGVLHLAAKFYAAGTTHVETHTDVPLVCRHFFELARRELSGSEK